MSDIAFAEARDLLRIVFLLWSAIHPAKTHGIQWVINPAQLDLIRSSSPAKSWYTAKQPNVPEQLLGMYIRVDEHAANPMLEAR